MMSGTKHLGPLGMTIVGLFDQGEKLSVQAVLEKLTAAGRKPAYTTVMTVLTRLTKKGWLTREKVGRRYLYGIAVQGAESREELLRAVEDRLHKSSLDVVLSLIENLTTDELEILQDAIREKL